jgi:hypothetical protein
MSTNPTVYHGVNSAIFSCVKTMSEKAHGTIYSPADANTGTATTTEPGTIVMTFAFDPVEMTLTYALTNKPWWVPEAAIWTGIADTINGCRGRMVAANKQKLTAPNPL